MNEQIPNQERTFTSPRRRTYLWLLALPLLACVACAALTVFTLYPLRTRIIDRLSGRMIPVTGEEPQLPGNTAPSLPLPDQKANPGGAPTATPEPGANRVPENGSSYRDLVDERLNTCTVSFHQFLTFQQSGFNRPELLANSGWRSRAKDAVAAFHDDCQALGSLPAAPTAYTQVDQLLKKAAAEVQPATDDFNALLDATSKGGTGTDNARSSMRHLLNFIRYTQNAEDVLSGLDEMKQI